MAVKLSYYNPLTRKVSLFIGREVSEVRKANKFEKRFDLNLFDETNIFIYDRKEDSKEGSDLTVKIWTALASRCYSV